MNTKATLTAVLLLAVSTTFAAPLEDSKQQNIEKQQTIEAFCNAAANIAYDSMLSGLKGEKREQAEKRLLKRFMPAAKHVKAREMVQETVTRLTGSIYQSKLNPNLEKSDYKYIAEEVGKGEFQLCMEAAMSN